MYYQLHKHTSLYHSNSFEKIPSSSIQINKPLYPSIDWQSLTEKQNHHIVRYINAFNTWTKFLYPILAPIKEVSKSKTHLRMSRPSVSRMKVEQVDILSPSTMIQSIQEWRSYEPLGVDNSIRRRTILRRLCWVNVLARRPQRPSSNLYEWNCPWNLCSYWGMIVSLRQNSCSLKATLYNHSCPANSDWLAIWSIAWRGWNVFFSPWATVKT